MGSAYKTETEIDRGLVMLPRTNYVDMGNGGSLTGAAKVVDLYVQPDCLQDGQTYVGVGNHGQDHNSGETPASALRSLDGLRRVMGAGAAAGLIFHAHIIGDGNDPVNSPARGRWMHIERGFRFPGEAGSWLASSRISGPRNHAGADATRVQPLTFVSCADDPNFPGRVGITFAQAVGGRYLLAYRNDGRKVRKHIPIVKIGGTGSKTAWVDIGAAGFPGSTTITSWLSAGAISWFWSVGPAIIVEGIGGDNPMAGMHWTGDVAYRLNDRRGTSGVTANDFDFNPQPTFRDLWFPRNTFALRGSARLDGCVLDDKTFFAPGCAYRFDNCYVAQFMEYQGEPGYLGGNSQLASTLDACGEMDSYVIPIDVNDGQPTMDPEHPTSGTDITIVQQGALYIGRPPQGAPGRLALVRGLAINAIGQGATYAVRVTGRGSLLWFHELAQCRLEGDNGMGGIWAQMGAQVRLPSQVFNPSFQHHAADATLNQLRLDGGAAISYADFVDATKWNKIFSRRLEVSANGGTFPKGLSDSEMWAPEAEPGWAGYVNPAPMSQYGSIF